MNPYITLFLAIIFEVLGTVLLPVSQNFTKPLPTTILLFSYGISFYFLAIVSQKLPLSLVYASWSGIGVFTIALLSYIFYKEAGGGGFKPYGLIRKIHIIAPNPIFDRDGDPPQPQFFIGVGGMPAMY